MTSQPIVAPIAPPSPPCTVFPDGWVPVEGLAGAHVFEDAADALAVRAAWKALNPESSINARPQGERYDGPGFVVQLDSAGSSFSASA